ncbi:uncharacterized protein LOC122790066 [Protopterus annectens]|uniref:uncharacterized protein LOC122790066 n=1 Tax=Protopterus annectens TaxID=7888 RepID=UPI001CFBC575|nr:uncharacterized protein LOC122790066 [Protopterus annectens]
MALPNTLTQSSAEGKVPNEMPVEKPHLCKEEEESSYPILKTEGQSETLICDINARNFACPDNRERYLGNSSVCILTDSKGEQHSACSHNNTVSACSQNRTQAAQPSPTDIDDEHKFNVSPVGYSILGWEESLMDHDTIKSEASHQSLLPDTNSLTPVSVNPAIDNLEEIQAVNANFTENRYICLTSCSKENNSSLEDRYLDTSSQTAQSGLQYGEIKNDFGTENLTAPQIHEESAVIHSETEGTWHEQTKGCCKDIGFDSSIKKTCYKEDANEEDSSQLCYSSPVAAGKMTVGLTEAQALAMSVNGTPLTEQETISSATVTEYQKSSSAETSEEQQSTSVTTSRDQESSSAKTSWEHEKTSTVTSIEKEITNAATLTSRQISNKAAVEEICLPTDIITLSNNVPNNESDQQREKKSITAIQLDESVQGPANQRSVSVLRQGVDKAGQEKEGLSITLTGEVKEKSLPVGEAEQDIKQEPGSAEREAQEKIGDYCTLSKASESLEQISTACFRQQGFAVKQGHSDSHTQSQNHSAMEVSGSYSAFDNLSDSGVSDDSSQSSTLDGPVELYRNETPIEREIRLAMEREEKLRQSRGISNSKPHEQYVEIQVKPILQQCAPKLSPVPKHKDRLIAGMQMMKEIEQESKREEDLVQLGKVKRMYDKGNPQELQEIKMVFEQVQEQQTDQFTSKNANNMKVSEADQTNKISTTGTRADSSDKPEAKKGPSFAEFGDSNVIIIEHGILLHPTMTVPAPATTSTPPAQVNPWPLDEQKVTVIESSSVFSKTSQTASQPSDMISSSQRASQPSDMTNSSLRSSQPSDMTDSTSYSTQDTLGAIQDNPFFKLRSKDSQSILEQEIRKVQEREEALQRQRCSLYGIMASPNHSSLTNVINSIQCTAPQEERPLGKLDIAWPPQPSSGSLLITDGANQPQQDRSPQNPRKKCALLQQWESGIFVNHHEDE